MKTILDIMHIDFDYKNNRIFEYTNDLMTQENRFQEIFNEDAIYFYEKLFDFCERHCFMATILMNQKPINKIDYMKCLCPFHEEKTPSMVLKEGKYTCFSCGENGLYSDIVEKLISLNHNKDRRSPKEHYVSRHLRKLNNGKVIKIKDHIRGNK